MMRIPLLIVFLASSLLAQSDSGIVVDFLGRPVPGARITTVDGKHTFTDGSGVWFARRQPHVAPWRIQARDTMQQVLHGRNQTTILQYGRRLLGRVLDGSGEPIAGAWVQVKSYVMELAATQAFTGAEGWFELDAPLGPLSVSVLADRHAQLELALTGELDQKVELTLHPASTATLALEIDSAAPESVIALLIISPDTPRAPSKGRTLRFGPTGSLTLRGLPPGEICVIASGPQEGFVSPARIVLSVDKTRRFKIKRIVPSLKEIRGVVRDTSNKVLGGVELRLNDSGHDERVIQVDAAGRFQFESLAPEGFPILMRIAEERWQIVAAASDGIDKNSALLPHTEKVSLVVERWRRVTGRAVDTTGRPIRGVPYGVMSPLAPNGVRGFRCSNARGDFSFLVPPGRPIFGRMFEVGTGEQHEFRVRPGDDKPIVLRLPQRSKVTGTLVNQRGKANAGAKVWLVSLASNHMLPAVLAGPAGGFGFSGLAPGEYELWSADRSLASGARLFRFTLTPGQAMTTDMLRIGDR